MEENKHTHSGDQKIKCSVVSCTHNCVDNCTCMLDKIIVCPCSLEAEGDKDTETCCGNYENCGNENIYGSKMY